MDGRQVDNSHEQDCFDVIVVGAGPAGLNAALVLARSCCSILVIDSNLPRNRFATEVHSFLGMDGVSPYELRRRGETELERYGMSVSRGCVVEARSIPPEKPSFRSMFEITIDDRSSDRCRKILFASGVTDEIPTIPGLSECYGRTVHHCPYCDGYEHRDAKLVAYSQKPAAAAALGKKLLGWSHDVVVVTGGAALTPEERNSLAIANVPVHVRNIVRAHQTDGMLRAIELENGEVLPADALFFSAGQQPQCSLPQGLGCRLESGPSLQTDARQRVEVCGVYVAGDAAKSLHFAITAASEGANAAVSIHEDLQKEDQAEASVGQSEEFVERRPA